MSLVAELQASSGWKGNAPAQASDIAALISQCKCPLPESLLTFLHHFDGGEGSLGHRMNVVRIMSTREICRYQEVWQVPKCLPGHILFGSDCGDFALLLDTRKGMVNGEYPVVMCPFSSLSPGDKEPYADGFPGIFYLTMED